MFKTVGVSGCHCAIGLSINKIVKQSRNFFGNFVGFFHSQDHEGRGVGIGSHAIVGNDGRTKDVLFGRITGMRINGMSIFFAVFNIIVAVRDRRLVWEIAIRLLRE
jgi:hypothetical protein